MNPQQIALVQSSFGLVAPIAEQAAALFYGRLFELDPALRPLFRGDMDEQGRKLMQMLTVVVRGLDRIEALVPAVEALGRRHGTYGVTDQHFDTVGAALLWTLDQGLGAEFTPDVEAAWTSAYVVLATTMKNAMADAGRCIDRLDRPDNPPAIVGLPRAMPAVLLYFCRTAL